MGKQISCTSEGSSLDRPFGRTNIPGMGGPVSSSYRDCRSDDSYGHYTPTTIRYLRKSFVPRKRRHTNLHPKTRYHIDLRTLALLALLAMQLR